MRWFSCRCPRSRSQTSPTRAPSESNRLLGGCVEGEKVKMSRDEIHIRDRLLLLAERSNPHKPFNVKRKSMLSKQSSTKTSAFSRKLSMQDFVRMDPGYTPDIEHLVFRKRNPQQVAPINPPAPPTKTRSRLAEMFALSKHLQQRSVDREAKRGATVNVSVKLCYSITLAKSGAGA